MRRQPVTRFGAFLFSLRGRHTIETVATRSGISCSTWSRIELGSVPDVVTLLRLRDTFGADLEHMVTLYREDFFPHPVREEAVYATV